jgi:hypothetical protein
MERLVVQMPLDAEVMCFDFQDDMPCIWAIVDPDVLLVPRIFEIFGTGHQIPGITEGCYVGTSQQRPFVWHLFELFDKPNSQQHSEQQK